MVGADTSVELDAPVVLDELPAVVVAIGAGVRDLEDGRRFPWFAVVLRCDPGRRACQQAESEADVIVALAVRMRSPS